MTVYLIHFDRPFGHARHYIGYSADEETLPRRLDHHRKGTGSTLMRHVSAAGIGWQVVRVWPDKGRLFERELKQHSGTRYCPTCNPTALRRKAA